MKLKALAGVLAVAGLAMPGMASATNGYFSHGYGMTAKGMGGAATAMAKDAMGGANNPASMVWVGDRMDIGIDWFRPIRSASRSGSAPFGMGEQFNGTMNSDSNDFFVPEFGYNMMMGSGMSLGISVYGNGGMNTDYKAQTGAYTCVAPGPALFAADNLLCGSGKLGMNLEQLIIAPTLAYKLNEQHSIGVAPLFGYQRFKAEGLQAFAGISTDAANLTNRGTDSATGWGVRLGWMGKITDSVTLGAAYSSKINMSKFDKYKGLFAEQGDFDIPENWSLGIAVQATPTVKVAVDYQRINYGDVKSVANPSTQPGCATGADAACLGGSNGIGFGWSNIDVWKLGVEYAYSPKLTLRAGYNRSDNPIQSRDVTFNIIAPGVVQDHYTLGFTYNLDRDSELTMAYMHAQENSVSGAPNTVYFNVGGTDKIKMYQDSLGVSYSLKF